MTQPAELLTVTLINKVLARGNSIFIFTSGVLRGKLITAETANVVPSPTFLRDVRWSLESPMETCAILTFSPSPRSPSKMKDPRTFKFTRKPQVFKLPERVLNAQGFHLTRIDGDAWMLNIVSSFKGLEA